MSDIPLAVGLLLGAALTGDPICPCPCPRPPGAADVALLPAPRSTAYDLNRQGRDLYRQRRWEEARARYRAALAADPGFLGPRLNLACALAQEGRHAEAVQAAAELVQLAYVPWAREVREARDLAPLHDRPERRRLDEAIARAAAAWGASLAGNLFYVARVRPAVRLPPVATGTLHLGLEQEIFAWNPRTGRHRQVTADDGRVLGFLASPDGRTLVYVRAGKLIRSPGQPDRFRDVTLRRLDVPTMSLGPPVPVPGDVERLRIDTPTPAGSRVEIVAVDGASAYRFDGQRLHPEPHRAAAALTGALILDGQGIAAARPLRLTLGGCHFQAVDKRPAKEPPAVRVRPPGRPSFSLPTTFGTGLGGLPLPK